MVFKLAIVVESNSRSKTCPLSLSVSDPRRPWPCIGAECMAWRWYETHVDDGQGGTKRDGETYGYCGLAGDPGKL